jgi:hypothetical protein
MCWSGDPRFDPFLVVVDPLEVEDELFVFCQ